MKTTQTLFKILIGMILVMTTLTSTAVPRDDLEQATFAGGCFWCMQSDFDKVPGVEKTVVGYTGGPEKNPTYEQVSGGQTGHAESIRVFYDPNKVNYETLLNIFWRNIDPTVKNRQFCDVGKQYRTAIFYHNNQQKQLAQQTKSQLEKTKFSQVYTEVVPANVFYLAEDYHQNYYKKNPVRYKFYRYNCGRDKRLKQLHEL